MRREQAVRLEHVRTVALSYNGECGLLGVGPDLSFYAEEIYGDEGWMAQHHFSFRGELLAGVDENCGENQGVERLKKPPNLVRPRAGVSDVRLNFGGAPHYGLVAEERIEEMVRPLDMADKAMLVKEGLVPPVPLPAILGLAQSYVTSEAQLVPPGRGRQPLLLLSRRLRVACRLPEPALGDAGEVYDYVSHEASVLQRYYPGDEGRSLGETVLTEAELGVRLNWLTDIVLREGFLFAADSAGGRDGASSRVHIWRVALG